MSLFLPLPRDRRVTRFVVCICGLMLCGLGSTSFIVAKIGTPPWDVFHQGLAKHLGISVGIAVELTGLVIIGFWFLIGMRPGWGTFLNAILIGLTVQLVLPHLSTPHEMWVRVLMVFAGLLLFGVGTGLYVGAGLGPGPRDGLMLALAERGVSLRVARTSIEIIVVIVGYLLGGNFGFGTFVFALGIGPVVQFTLPRLTIR